MDVGLFGPGSVTWRLHDEPILWLAGVRSLLLQALHPRAMAAVAQNSNFRDDPWGRLIRTSTYIGTVVFGTTAQAEAAGRRIRRLHARLHGTDPRTGERFRVDDPDLLRWVHVAEVESFVSTARRAGVRLSDADTDAYFTEQRRAAALVGLDPETVPGTAAEVTAYYEAVRPDLGISQDAARALLFIAAPPLPWGLGLTPARLAYGGVVTTAFALLPAWARRMYGVPGLSITDLPASLSVRALRAAMAPIPRALYASPVYRDAMKRVGGA
ncbi:MAG TPA: oxygenase MpaB family protein [Micromonosporaceae bacterium]|nr:oxygenase MpaB family protein [Micromonosporaceae bacterium]